MTGTSTHRADVIVPIYRDVAMTLRCLESVLDTGGDELRSLIAIDDQSPEPAMAEGLDDLARRDSRVRVIHNEANLGFVETCNRGIARREGDVVLLNSDTLVTPGWLRELSEVAHHDDRTACVTPLSDNATICSVPEILNGGVNRDVDAAVVKAACAGLPRWTEVPTGVGFCLYMTAGALDIVGLLDPIFAPGYNEENDWVKRAQAVGFRALRANHAFVHHLGSVSFRGEKNELEARNRRILQARHPHYVPQVERFFGSLDCHLAAHATRVESTRRLRVALDLRHITPSTVGTSIYAAQLAKGLSRLSDIGLTLIVRDPRQAHGVQARVVHEEFRLEDVEVIHRPAQVFEPSDLGLLLGSPAHLVVSWLDLIAHRVQSHFADQAQADRYRTTSYLTMQAAQATIAISGHAGREIASEYGIPEGEIHVTPLGVDRDAFLVDDARARRALSRLKVAGRYFLSVATDFPHKNLGNLIDAYALFRSSWTGPDAPPSLVLTGNRVTSASGAYEHLTVNTPPGIRYVGQVGNEALASLFQAAEALVYPSAYEGFGLPLLEAMTAGTPVIAMPVTSIPEVGGDAILYTRGLSAKALASAMTQIATNRDLRADLIERGSRRVSEYTWDRTARMTRDVYRSVVSRPSSRSLTARRLLNDANMAWASGAEMSYRAASFGIRSAWKELDRAMRVRARRELGRLKLRGRSA